MIQVRDKITALKRMLKKVLGIEFITTPKNDELTGLELFVSQLEELSKMLSHVFGLDFGVDLSETEGEVTRETISEAVDLLMEKLTEKFAVSFSTAKQAGSVKVVPLKGEKCAPPLDFSSLKPESMPGVSVQDGTRLCVTEFFTGSDVPCIPYYQLAVTVACQTKQIEFLASCLSEDKKKEFLEVFPNPVGVRNAPVFTSASKKDLSVTAAERSVNMFRLNSVMDKRNPAKDDIMDYEKKMEEKKEENKKMRTDRILLCFNGDDIMLTNEKAGEVVSRDQEKRKQEEVAEVAVEDEEHNHQVLEKNDEEEHQQEEDDDVIDSDYDDVGVIHHDLDKQIRFDFVKPVPVPVPDVVSVPVLSLEEGGESSGLDGGYWSTVSSRRRTRPEQGKLKENAVATAAAAVYSKKKRHINVKRQKTKEEQEHDTRKAKVNQELGEVVLNISNDDDDNHLFTLPVLTGSDDDDDVDDIFEDIDFSSFCNINIDMTDIGNVEIAGL